LEPQSGSSDPLCQSAGLPNLDFKTPMPITTTRKDWEDLLKEVEETLEKSKKKR
jgi:hypothetical protein